jgi:gamma-glutamyltranspeptidase/glutathione hydrolase
MVQIPTSGRLTNETNETNERMISGVNIVCRGGAVATGPAEAAEVGAATLQRGGNAMDAAAAACLACSVLEPQAVDLGGYVLAAMVLEADTGHIWSLDANTVAPAAATPDMFRTTSAVPDRRGINEREWGCSVVDDANVYGPLSISVPGFLGGVGMLWERWGKLKWPQIVAPVQALVEKGLSFSRLRKDVDFKREAIARYPSTSVLLNSDNDLWMRPELAATLDRLATTGWRDFYCGEIGRRIADFVASQGGILTRDDMASFVPRITEPCSGTYHGAEIHTAISPNGGFSVIEALADLEQHWLPPDSDAGYWERMAQTLARMWSNRLADSSPSGVSAHGTVHVAAVDRHGNVVSATISQGGLFGSCLAVPGTGIIPAHGMCRFDPHPGLANSPSPGKRPLNNVCPLIVRMPDRDIAIGTRGERRIVSVTVQMAQRIADYGAGIYDAAVAPRIHTLTGDPIEISANFDPVLREALERAGYRIEVPDEVAGAAHGAEFRRSSREIRAGGNTWAAGI